MGLVEKLESFNKLLAKKELSFVYYLNSELFFDCDPKVKSGDEISPDYIELLKKEFKEYGVRLGNSYDGMRVMISPNDGPSLELIRAYGEIHANGHKRFGV